LKQSEKSDPKISVNLLTVSGNKTKISNIIKYSPRDLPKIKIKSQESVSISPRD